MRQVLQDLRSGRIELAEVPCPRPGPNELLIRTTASVLSPGTERMLLEFGRAGWIGCPAWSSGTGSRSCCGTLRRRVRGVRAIRRW